MSMYILTVVKKKIIVFDDESTKVLERQVNQSAYVREAVKYMSQDISTDTLKGIRRSYQSLAKLTQEINSKVDYIAKKMEER